MSIDTKVHTELWKISPHVIGLEASIIREILKISSKPGVINLAGGLPAPELFPIKELQKCMLDVIEKNGPAAFQYSFLLRNTSHPLQRFQTVQCARRGLGSSCL